MKNIYRYRLLPVICAAMVLWACASVQPSSSGSGPAEFSADAAYHYIVGYGKEMDRDYNGAVAYYREAVRDDPSSLHLRTELARALLKAGENDEALETVLAVIEAAPRDVMALVLLGDIYRYSGDAENAIGAYKRAVRVDPDRTDVWIRLGSMHQARKEYRVAEKAYEKVRELGSHSFMATYYLGNLYLEKGDLEGARRYFEEITRDRPEFEPPYVSLGYIAEQMEEWDTAVENYRAALAINPDNRQVRERLAGVLVKSDSYQGAIREFQRMSEANPQDVDIHFQMGVLHVENEMYEKAEKEFLQVLDAAPDNVSALYYLGIVYQELGRFDDAIVRLKQVINASPSEVRAYLQLAYLYGQTERMDQAIETYEEVLEFRQDLPEIYLYLGAALIQADRLDKARETLDKGLELASEEGKPDFLFNLAVVEEKEGNFEEMVRLLKETIALNPEHAEALNYLGYSYAEMGIQLDEAIELIKRALKLKPDSGYIRDSLAWAFYKKGMYSEALEEQLKAVKDLEEDPTVYDHLGDIYLKIGRPDDAEASWRKALEVVGDDSKLEKSLRGKLGLP